MLALVVGAPCCLAAPPDTTTINNAIGIVTNFNPGTHYDLKKIKKTILFSSWEKQFPKTVMGPYEVDNGPYITKDDIVKNVNEVTNIFRDEPSLLKINSDSGVMVVGDLHANIDSTKGILLNFLERCRLGEVDNILFLGDYTDREFFGIETLYLLYQIKSIMPENVHLIRGNHEDLNLQSQQMYSTVFSEMTTKYNLESENIDSSDLFCSIKDSYNMLPVAAIINDTCFCVHGGLSPEIIKKDGIKKIEQIQRPCSCDENSKNESERLISSLCWNEIDDNVFDGDDDYYSDNDSSDNDHSSNDDDDNDYSNGFSGNTRGFLTCSWNVIKKFLANNNLNTLISGHVHKNIDTDTLDDRYRHITLLSSENFFNEKENKCCIAVIKNGRDTVIEHINNNGENVLYVPQNGNE